MPAIIRGAGQKLRDYTPPPKPTFHAPMPLVKARPYRTIFMELQAQLKPKPVEYSFVSLQCEYESKKPARESTFNRAVNGICAAFDVKRIDLLGTSRKQSCAKPRQALFLMMSEVLPWSLPQIGRACNRDHTTVMHGIRRAKGFVETDPEFRARFFKAMSIACKP